MRRKEIITNPKETMEIIAVANQKGGVGKSTSTINIAAMLAKYGNKVLIIDMDPQGHSTKGLGINLEADSPTVADALCDSEEYFDDEWHKIVQKTYQENLFVLPSNLKLALAEMKLSSMGAKEFKLRSIIPNLGDFDFVFIDCPPTFTTLTINAFTSADEILMPVQMSYFCMEGIDGFLQAVNFVNKQINPVVQHKIEITNVLITFHDPRTKLSRTIAESIKDIFGIKILEQTIPVNIKLGEAQSQGKAIYDYDADCTGAKAYEAVTNELLSRWSPKTICTCASSKVTGETAVR